MLRRELRDLGLSGLKEVPGGVVFKGPFADGMRACLWSRISMRVLMLLGRGETRGGHDLYDLVRSLPLSAYFDADATLRVFARENDSRFNDSRFIGLKTKDAIVDEMRDRHGRRPDVDSKNADIDVVVHVHGTDTNVYLDLAGKPLFMRGTRTRDVDAPLKENVAAALLQFSGWNKKRPLHDPTCGGGTIAIEAAGMAMDRAPGLGRTMGFEKWPLYVEHLDDAWTELVTEADERRRDKLRGVIIASDIDKKAVGATRANLAAAELLDDVIVRRADARKVEALLGGGFFVFNPPYGERIGGDDGKVAELYLAIAERLFGFDDHTVSLISTERALEDDFAGAEPTRACNVLNGKLRCRMLTYEP